MKSIINSFIKVEGIKVLLVLILILIFISHSGTDFFKTVGYSILLILFFRSRRNYLWFALIFVALDFPGGLLSSSNLIFLPAFRDYMFHEAFVIVAFIKSLKQSRGDYKIINKFHVFILILIVFHFVISIPWGVTGVKALRALRFAIPWILLISTTKLLSEEDFSKLFKLFFALLPIGVIIHFMGFIYGANLATVIFGAEKMVGVTGDTLQRETAGITIAFLGMLGSLVYYNDSRFNISQHNIVLILSAVFIVSTGTRGWFIGLIGALLFYALILSTGKRMITRISALGASILLILFVLPSSIITQIKFAIDRLLTIEALALGDKTAGGSLGRLTNYAPVMNEAIMESPFFGYGIMDEYAIHSNAHLGYHNLLIQSGFVGLFVFYGGLIMFLGSLYKKAREQRTYSTKLVGIISAFIFLLLVNMGAHYIGVFPSIINAHYLQVLLIVFGSALYYSKPHLHKL